jgi:hypothetical protein
MPRYYFDLKFDGEEPSLDEEGMELPELEIAQIEASRTLCDFSREIIGRGRQLTSLSVIVRDDRGPALSAQISFKNLRPH